MARNPYLICIILMNALSIKAQSFTESNLPIVVISTNGKTIVDEPKIVVDFKIIYNGIGKLNRLTDTIYNYVGKAAIELRGSSSQSISEKKPYSIELRDAAGKDQEVALLGMAKTEDWALIAPYSDKSQIRDALTYRLAGEMMTWSPDTRFCELFLNNEYRGIYVITERIKRSKDLLNIAKLDTFPNATGDALTGGYILKVDKNTGNTSGIEAGWSSNYKMYSYNRTFFQYHYPEPASMKTPQKNYIKNAVNTFETALFGSDFKDSLKGYRAYFDVNSLIDFCIINELTKNVDGYRISTYFYKDRNSINPKFKMGPVWDFNLGLGNANYCNAVSPYGWQYLNTNECSVNNPFWWQRFFEDPYFKKAFRDRWLTLRKTTLSIPYINKMIDSMTTVLNAAQGRNFKRWDYLTKYVWPVPQIAGTYAGEIDFLKNWTAARIAWIDDEVRGFHLAKLPNNLNELDVFPNPATTQLNFAFYLNTPQRVSLKLYNTVGELTTQYDETQARGDNLIELKTPSVSGVYFYQFLLDGKLWRVGKVVVR
jgi:hypothetical protein